MVLSSGLMVVSGVAAAYSVNIEMLIIMRFLLGVFTAGARNAAFVYGKSYRLIPKHSTILLFQCIRVILLWNAACVE